MKNNLLKKYYLITFCAVLLASVYPIYMGVRVCADMIRYGTVFAEQYPKYIIPYTPIALAVLIGVLLMPFLCSRIEKYAVFVGQAAAAAVFFTSEFLLESAVTVTRTVTESVLVPSKLENWQMYMCYVAPGSTQERTWTEVDVLIGEYSPAFKLHFYIISIVLILSILNCFYGFAKMIRTGDFSRKRALSLQAAASGVFLGLCIWACFTAFYRTGELLISPISAVLMTVFFVTFGVTVGFYAQSLTFRRSVLLSVAIPSVLASVTTLIMYLGEMILLSGNLYRFGNGIFFDGLGILVLAPVDIAVILASGAITAISSAYVRRKNKTES